MKPRSAGDLHVRFLGERSLATYQEQILAIAEHLEIPYLVHFTRAENLESIINNGIYPVNRVEEVCENPTINDALRLDGRREGTSISVAFPNCQMLYKYRREKIGSEWVILILQPSVLWIKDCAFCKFNAADIRIRNLPIEYLKTPQSFMDLFAELEGGTARADLNLKSFDPTDVQAEVLVFDVIEPQLIELVVFDSFATKARYESAIGERKTCVYKENKGLFGERGYVRKYYYS